MSQPPIDDDFQDRIQRILNEKKKDDLRAQYGMQLEGHSEDISPQAEGEWLDYITEFEQQFENAKQITVRERIGNPVVRSLAEIPDSELEAELDNLFELLYQNNIAIDFIHEQDDREVYRFITEELLNETTDDIRIPGMVSHFIYEEFHPNDRDDVEQAAHEFLYALFKQELKATDSMFYHIVSIENMHDSDGNPISQEQFKKMVVDFYEAYPIITEHSIEVTEVTLDGDNATADVHTIWHAIPKDKNSVSKHEGVSKLKLMRSIYGGWDVTQANIPDWNFS
jgi:hypothetical protein